MDFKMYKNMQLESFIVIEKDKLIKIVLLFNIFLD